MSQLSLEPPDDGGLSDARAKALAGTILGFAAPGKWDSGSKIPAEVIAEATRVARSAVAEARAIVAAR